MPRKTKPKSTRKRGAQPGNSNAMRHGFYARHFTATEHATIESVTERDLESEIIMARVAAARVYQAFIDSEGEEMIAIFKALTDANIKLGTLLRTQKLLRGEGAGDFDLLAAALAELAPTREKEKA
jgi:hypothetical protein